MPETFPTTIIQENIFWIQILGDHARFIYNALAPNEKEEIEKARNFIKIFDDLLLKVQQINPAATERVTQLNQEAAKAALEMHIFQLRIVSRLLTQGMGLDMEPAMINHFERETKEYLYLLNYYEKYNNLRLDPMRLHLVWLNDFMGHSAFIQDRIGYTYKEVRKEASEFQNNFETIFIRAMAINDYLATGLEDFPALKQLGTDAVNLMKRYSGLYLDIESQINSRRLIGNLTILWLDHMHREQCYYETKLAQVMNVQIEKCDPASPRIEYAIPKTYPDEF